MALIPHWECFYCQFFSQFSPTIRQNWLMLILSPMLYFSHFWITFVKFWRVDTFEHLCQPTCCQPFSFIFFFSAFPFSSRCQVLFPNQPFVAFARNSFTLRDLWRRSQKHFQPHSRRREMVKIFFPVVYIDRVPYFHL